MSRILLVEPGAGDRAGHFMTRVEALARAMNELGHDVHIFTGSPLAIEAEGRTLDGIARVHAASAWWRRVDRWSLRLARFEVGRPRRAARRPMRRLGEACQQLALMHSVRSRARALGDPPTLVLSTTLWLETVALLAPRPSRWTVYELRTPQAGETPPSRTTRLLSGFIARLERRRRRAGGWTRLVANGPRVQRTWTLRHPWLESVVISPAAIPDVVPEAREVARATLGVDPAERVGLLFGVAHPLKDVHVVFLAFAGGSAPSRLVAAGKGMQRVLDDVKRQHPSATFPLVTILDGPRTDREKHLLHSAADYAIVSTTPGFANDSGTLADAVGYGLPICCSDTCEPGVLVDEHRLGLTFVNGDAGSLRETAERLVDFELGGPDRAAFMNARSDQAVARRFLAVTVGADHERAT